MAGRGSRRRRRPKRQAWLKKEQQKLEEEAETSRGRGLKGASGPNPSGGGGALSRWSGRLDGARGGEARSSTV